MRATPLLHGCVAVALVTACSDDPNPIDRQPDAGVVDSGPDGGLDRPDAGGEDANPVPAPRLTSLRPTEGSEEGGTLVTLRGQLFEEPVVVRFGDVEGANATLLDATSVQVVAPPGAVGDVDVTLATPGGEVTLPDAFRYLPVLEVTSVEPARIPDEGGALLTLRGRGFTDDTLVLLDRKPLGGWIRIDDTEMQGVAPPLAPGRPELRVITPENDARRSDLVVVYATPTVTAVEPPVVDAAGGTRMALAGEGLSEVESVEVGGAPAALVAIASDRVEVETPAVAEGRVAIDLVTPDVRYPVPVPVFAVGASTGFEIFGLTPGQVVRGGGQRVRIAARGVVQPVTVDVGGEPAGVLSVTPNEIEIEVPAVLDVGSHAVEVTAANGSGATPEDLVVVDPLDVLAVSPESASADEATALTVVGTGFVPGTRVTVGGFPLENVVIVDSDTLTGELSGGAGGTVDVVVTTPDGRQAALQSGFTFEEAFEVIRVEPDDGSIAGNTYVSVFGRGLRGPVAVDFGSEAGVFPGLENGSILAVRAPPGDIGFVDLSIRSGAEELVIEEGYEYFNPRLVTGGGFGGPIRGDVNVAVVDGQGNPLSGVPVQLGYDAEERLRQTTDADGLATVSWPDVVGPQTVTAGRTGFEFTTFTDVNARNLTIISSENPQPPPDDAPINPCADNQPPRIRGRIFGLKSSVDPDRDPNIQPVVTITYSQPNVFTSNPPMPPGQITTVASEGEVYEIVTARAGTVAVYAVLEEVNVNNGQVVARRRLGLRRGVPAVPNEVTEGVDIELSIELDQTVEVRLDEPPRQSPGPSLNAVFPFLNVGSDGVIAFPPQGATTQDVTLENMPRLAQSEFIYLAGSLTQAGGGLGAPFSLAIQPSSGEPDEGTDVGPFLQPPQNITPKAGEVLVGGLIRYEREGLVPDLSITDFNDAISFFPPPCCVDLNQNGSCEDGEPLEGGGFPVSIPFTRWSIYGPGDRLSIELPRLPPTVDAFERPQFIGFGIQQARVPRFTFQEFTYAQFSPLLWESWTSVSSSVLIKEVTD